MAVEQHAKLVDAVLDVMLGEDVMLVLHAAGMAEHFVQRQNRVVRGMIGVMAGRAVDDLRRRRAPSDNRRSRSTRYA